MDESVEWWRNKTPAVFFLVLFLYTKKKIPLILGYWFFLTPIDITVNRDTHGDATRDCLGE